MNDARPLLALALLRQERGNEEAVHTLLEQAWERRDAKGLIDLLIDAVAEQLGLSEPVAPLLNNPALWRFRGVLISLEGRINGI